MSIRIGAIEFEFSTVVVLTLIVFFTMGAGGFVNQLQDLLNRGFANMDKIRIDNSVEALHGEPSGRVRLDLHNAYNFSLYPNGILMDAAFIDQGGLDVLFVPWFTPRFQEDISGSEIRTDEICIIKQGYYVTIAGPNNCDPQPCGPPDSSPLGMCSTFTPQAQQEQARTTGSGEVDTGEGEWYQFEEGVPASGYVCENGAFTEEDFYVKYREVCDPPSDEDANFIDINRVSCPSQGLQDAWFGCVVDTTLRCPAGDKINVSVDEPDLESMPALRAEFNTLSEEQRESRRVEAGSIGSELTFEEFLSTVSSTARTKKRSVVRRCSGEIQHERVPFTLKVLTTARRFNFEFTVSTSEGEESMTAEGIRVLP